jgi:hypothetical protein
VLVRNTAIELSHDRKHKPQYLGPYEIDLRTAKGNYRLKELDGTPMLNVYAAYRVLPYITRDHPFMRNHEAEASAEEEAENSTTSESEDSE